MVISKAEIRKLPHGRVKSYNLGCRCKCCKEAVSLYRKRVRRKEDSGAKPARRFDDLLDIMVELGMAEYAE